MTTHSYFKDRTAKRFSIAWFENDSALKIEMAENTTLVRTMIATDADEDQSLIYAIEMGDDRSLFTIDESTGELSFGEAPQVSNPQDEDGDGVYKLTISVTDGYVKQLLQLEITVRSEI